MRIYETYETPPTASQLQRNRLHLAHATVIATATQQTAPTATQQTAPRTQEEEHATDSSSHLHHIQVRIYDPYYCNGGVISRLRKHGFLRVYNRREDFYEQVANKASPLFRLY